MTVGDQAYALEHTKVQPFPNRIGLANAYHFIAACIEQWFPLPLPGSASYELHIPLDIRLPGRGKKGERHLATLREWIEAKVDVLHARAPACPPPSNPYVDALDLISGRPCGWNCEFTIARSRDGVVSSREFGSFSAYIGNPDDLEGAFMDEVRRAFREKTPKLARHKERTNGDRTILVMEGIEMGLGYDLYISNHLPTLLGECPIPPDDIFLVCPGFPFWHVWVVKWGEIYWPDERMPMPHNGYQEFATPASYGYPTKVAEAMELSLQRREPQVELRPYFLNEDELEDIKPT